jgi:hypothetical protein
MFTTHKLLMLESVAYNVQIEEFFVKIKGLNGTRLNLDKV